MIKEKKISYQTTNTYSTLNTYTSKTKNVWIVFHGLGYLSRYFIKYFSHLNTEENYIIAPQAPSKYYQDDKFKHVGASWLTRENTMVETQNILNYIDAVYNFEIKNFKGNLLVLGYSQGVSIAARWVANKKIKCNHLILHSGGIPTELKPEDFEFLPATSKVTYLYGNKDRYITEARITEQTLIGNKLFGDKLQIQVFNGTHEVNKEFLLSISK